MAKKGIWHKRQCLECGAAIEVSDCRLKAGRGKYCSKSCGIRSRGRKHGHTTHNSQSKTYNSWAMMRARCTNPNSPKYPTYGAVGITVCDEWSKFENFLNDMGERPEGMTLDRVDNNEGYHKGNCRWSTPRRQQRNLKATRKVVYLGELWVVADLAEHLGVKRDTLRHRIKFNWPQSEWGAKPSLTRARRGPTGTILAQRPSGSPDP